MFQPHKPKSTGGPRLSRPGFCKYLIWHGICSIVWYTRSCKERRKSKEKKNMATKVTKKKTEKPGKFPWQSSNEKLVDDISLVVSITELIWRSFDKERESSKLPVLGRMDQADTAVLRAGQTDSERIIFETAGLLPKFWLMPLDIYRRWIRVLCMDVEKAKRMIFKKPIRYRGPEQAYKNARHIWEMGLKAELLFVGIIDQSKEMECPECGCYAIFRIPGTNRCIVAFLYGDGARCKGVPFECEHLDVTMWKHEENDGRDA